MRAFCEVVKTARRLGLITIADAKRGDIGTTSAAYAEAFLGDGDFNCDAVTVNPYQGSDALMPFIAKVKSGRGIFVLVKTSNPSSGEFQDRSAPDSPIWEAVAARVNGWGGDFVGDSGLSSIGAVVGATYPVQARRARELMPTATILVPDTTPRAERRRTRSRRRARTAQGLIVDSAMDPQDRGVPPTYSGSPNPTLCIATRRRA